MGWIWVSPCRQWTFSAADLGVFWFEAPSATRARPFLQQSRYRFCCIECFLSSWASLATVKFGSFVVVMACAEKGQGFIIFGTPKAQNPVDVIAVFQFWRDLHLISFIWLPFLQRSTELNWTRLASLDTWFPYRKEPDGVFYLLGGRTTLYRGRPVDGHALLIGRPVSLLCVFRCWMLIFECRGAHERTQFSWYSCFGFFDAEPKLFKDKFPPCTDYDNSNDWNSADVLLDSEVDVCVTSRQHFNETYKMAVWPTFYYLMIRMQD